MTLEVFYFISNDLHLTAMESCDKYFDFHVLLFTSLKVSNIHSVYLKKFLKRVKWKQSMHTL